MEKDRISLHHIESNEARLVVNKDCFIKIFLKKPKINLEVRFQLVMNNQFKKSWLKPITNT